MKTLKILILLTFLCACKNTNSTETPKHPAIEVDTIPASEVKKEEVKTFYATVDQLRLRKTPDKKAAVLEKIKEGEALLFLGEESEKKEKIKLRNRWQEAPWMKVESQKGNQGWVFGGALSEQAPKEDFSKLPYDKCEAAYEKNQDNSAYFKCYEKIAKQQEKKDSRYIKPKETGYEVTLLSGEKRNLFNETEVEQELREYRYRYYLGKIGYFVFRINRYEAGEYILMDDKFGYAMPLMGMPRLAPDLTKLLVTNNDQGAGFELNIVQLFEIREEGLNPDPIFEEEVEQFQVLNPVWIDSSRVEMDFISFDYSDKKLNVKATLEEGEDGIWRLTYRNME